MKLRINSGVALVLYTLVMAGGYVWASFYTTAPFTAYATAVSGCFTAYITKRLIQKSNKYNGQNN